MRKDLKELILKGLSSGANLMTWLKKKDMTVMPRGYIPVFVGIGEEMEKFLVHTKLFEHPHIKALLEMAAREFGYEQEGVLKIPCDVEQFKHMIQTPRFKPTSSLRVVASCIFYPFL